MPRHLRSTASASFLLINNFIGLGVGPLLMGALSAAREAGETQGGIAFGAHIGGFIAGLILVALFKKRSVPLWRRH